MVLIRIVLPLDVIIEMVMWGVSVWMGVLICRRWMNKSRCHFALAFRLGNSRTSSRREHLTPETSQTQLNKQGPRKIKAFSEQPSVGGPFWSLSGEWSDFLGLASFGWGESESQSPNNIPFSTQSPPLPYPPTHVVSSQKSAWAQTFWVGISSESGIWMDGLCFGVHLMAHRVGGGHKKSPTSPADWLTYYVSESLPQGPPYIVGLGHTGCRLWPKVNKRTFFSFTVFPFWRLPFVLGSACVCCWNIVAGTLARFVLEIGDLGRD